MVAILLRTCPISLPLTHLSVAFSLPYANIVRGGYRYIEDLEALTCTSRTAPQTVYPWTRYHNPVDLDRLRPFLHSHPDQNFVAVVFNGLRFGFCIGFDHQGKGRGPLGATTLQRTPTYSS